MLGSVLTKQEQVLDRRQSLTGVPVLNQGILLTPGKDGDLLVTIPMRRRAGFFGRFQPICWERKIQLDTPGTFVLQQIDGKRNALQITEAFIAQFKVNRREAELSTVEFLKSLLERQIISIGIP